MMVWIGHNHHANLATVNRPEVVEPLRLLAPDIRSVALASVIENRSVATLDSYRRDDSDGQSGFFRIARQKSRVT